MKTFNYHRKKVSLKASSYRSDGTLAIQMIQKNGEYDIISINLNSPMQSDSMCFLDTNNYPDIGMFLQKYNLAAPMGYTQRSGFCQYGLWTIFTDRFND